MLTSSPQRGAPGRQAPPSEFPLCLGPGQTPRLESQAVSGYRSPGCWQVTPGTGLTAGSVPLGFPQRRASGSAVPGNPGNGRVAGPASMEGPPWGRVLPVSGGQRQAALGAGGQEGMHTHPAGGRRAGAGLWAAEVPARAQGSNLCHRRPPAGQ